VSVNVVGSRPLPRRAAAPRTGHAFDPAQDGIVDGCDKTL
jgi:hypothetical protein